MNVDQSLIVNANLQDDISAFCHAEPLVHSESEVITQPPAGPAAEAKGDGAAKADGASKSQTKTDADSKLDQKVLKRTDLLARVDQYEVVWRTEGGCCTPEVEIDIGGDATLTLPSAGPKGSCAVSKLTVIDPTKPLPRGSIQVVAYAMACGNRVQSAPFVLQGA